MCIRDRSSSIKVNWGAASVISSSVITKGFSYFHVFDYSKGAFKRSERLLNNSYQRGRLFEGGRLKEAIRYYHYRNEILLPVF